MVSETFEAEGLTSRGIKLPRDVKSVDSDSHMRRLPWRCSQN